MSEQPTLAERLERIAGLLREQNEICDALLNRR